MLSICTWWWGHLLEHGQPSTGHTPKEKWLWLPQQPSPAKSSSAVGGASGVMLLFCFCCCFVVCLFGLLSFSFPTSFQFGLSPAILSLYRILFSCHRLTSFNSVVDILECLHSLFKLLEHSSEHFDLFVWEFLQVVPIGVVTMRLLIFEKSLS